MEIRQKITLSVDHAKMQSYYAKQNDNNTRVLEITLTKGDQPIQIPKNEKATVRYTRADGRGNEANAVVQGNEVIVRLTDEMLALSGTTYLDVALHNGTDILSSSALSIITDGNPLAAEKITGSSDFLILIETLDRADKNAKAVETLLPKATQATADANSAATAANAAAKRAEDAADGVVTVDTTLTKAGEAADAKAAGDKIENETTFLDEEKSQSVIYDGISNAQLKGYVSKTNAFTFDELIGSTLKKVEFSAKTGTSVKLGIFKARNQFPQSTTDGRLILKKVKDLGESVAKNNIATFPITQNVVIETDDYIVASALDRSLGWQQAEGHQKDIYAYNRDSYNLEIGGECEEIRDTGVASGPRPVYSVEYITTGNVVKKKTNETIKEILPEIKKIPFIDKDVKDIKDKIATLGQSSAFESKYNFQVRESVNKYFVLLVDDLTRDIFDVVPALIENNIYPALGIKMEVVPGYINWDEMRKLQAMGFELAFHGMLHGHTPAGTAPNKDDVMNKDIEDFLALCKENDIYIKGYLGPNHYPLPVAKRRNFEWARSAYGLEAFGAFPHLSDSFANLTIWSCDPVQGVLNKASMIEMADKLSDNQYLTPMCHTQYLVSHINDYLEVFNSWKSKGLVCLRPCDAVRQSLWDCGGIGQNSTFEIQAGTASSPYFIVDKNGNVRTNQTINNNV